MFVKHLELCFDIVIVMLSKAFNISQIGTQYYMGIIWVIIVTDAAHKKSNLP